LSNVKITKGQLMTVPQAAKKSGLAETTIRRYATKGYLEKHRIGQNVFVYYRELLRASWIADQKDLNTKERD